MIVTQECRPEDESSGYKVEGLCPVRDETFGLKLAKDGLHLVDISRAVTARFLKKDKIAIYCKNMFIP